ncbi:SGT1-domain-containing protein [Cryptosporidium felis]|nr:SGT1-domain-containing protein [Cryptosporidium felis]
MSNFAQVGENELLGKILELTKSGYGFEDENGNIELRFFFLDELFGHISEEAKEGFVCEVYRKFIELGIFGYNWDTVPFLLEFWQLEGVNCVRCWVDLGTYHLDEWYVVYLGYKITEKCKRLGLQVVSSDGDPILIDLAEVLPEWIKPDNSENRCFLLEGRVYLIPPELTEAKNLDLGSALRILRSQSTGCLTKESFTQIFMEKFESISKINQSEKFHNFFVILPKKIAGMILEFHYLLGISLKYLLNNRHKILGTGALKKTDGMEKELEHFSPKELVRIKICMTRTQYSRFINEALLTKLPVRFSRNTWMDSLPEDLRDSRYHSELLHGCLLVYGLYLVFSANPPDSSNIFIWKFTGSEWGKFEKETDLNTVVKKSLELKKEVDSLENGNFRTFWSHFLRKNGDFDLKLTQKVNECSDSSSWMNNDDYSKKLIEEIQKIYSDGTKSQRNASFGDILEEQSHFEGLDLNQDSDLPEGKDFSDFSIESDLTDQDYDDLHEIMRKMDEELEKTLKTTVPTLTNINDAKKFAESVYSETLKLEESFGIVGPASVFKQTKK